MASELLLDTGALVSLLDRRQQHHQAVLHFFSRWHGDVVSTEAVLTESTYLLSRVSGGAEACLQFFLRGGAHLVPASHASLRRARELMVQYADLPMDYADATLVVLAEELRTNYVLTTDRRDFHIYRAGSEHFEVFPVQGTPR